MYKKILVPLDGSALAEEILPHVETLAKTLEVEVILLRVIIEPAAEFIFSDPSIGSTIIRELEAESLDYLTKIRSKLQHSGIHTSIALRQGQIAETILTVAKEQSADLIAMSTHGRSGLQRWLMGSIADRIVHHSPVPVLLVRPPSTV